MKIQIYKELGKNPPEKFNGVCYTPFFREYLKYACTLETFKDSYKLEGPDEVCKKDLVGILESEPKHYLGIDRLSFTEEGSASWTEPIHISNDRFPWALKNSVSFNGYLSSPWSKDIDFEITPVSSVAEAEEIQRNYIPPGQRKGLFIKTEE